MYSYNLGKKGLLKVMYKSFVAIQYLKVQHCDVHANSHDRMGTHVDLSAVYG
jgi:hypothetical protein